MSNERIKMISNKDGIYTSEEGHQLKRETDPTMPSSFTQWVLRNQYGEKLDEDDFTSDILERNKLELISTSTRKSW